MSSSRTAIIAFVPVLHKGYIDFLSSHAGDIWIFGRELINQFVHLTRDLRVIEPEDVAKALQVLFPSRTVNIATPALLSEWKYDLTYMPEDEVCSDIAGQYIPKSTVEFVPVFLRWNKVISFQEHVVDPKRKITIEEFHQKVMQGAFKEAEKSSDWWRQIGAVVVKEGKVVLQSHNHHLPTDFHLSVNGDPRSNFDAGQHQNIFTSIHAEAELIARAAKEGVSLSGTALYSTTFPCPNCARLIGTAGVKTVYYSKGYSLLDAEQILAHFGVEIVLVQ